MALRRGGLTLGAEILDLLIEAVFRNETLEELIDGDSTGHVDNLIAARDHRQQSTTQNH